MAIQIQNATGNVLEVDPAFKAARMTLRPAETLSWMSVGAQSGSMTTLAASAPVFSFRNLSANLIIVRRVGIGFLTTTAFTTPQVMEFGLLAARAFTVSDSGGTAVALTGNNAKHRTSLGTLTSVDCRIATAALTAGTRSLDANTLAQQAGWSGGAGVTIAPSPSNLLSHDAGDYPLVLAQNEGFIIQNLTLMGAAGVGKAYVNMELAEATSY